MDMIPRVFIGSSTEGLSLAHAIQQNLERVAECTVWDQGVFEPSGVSLVSLLEELERSDFGVFVLSPDDEAMIRGEARSVARDNVVFEAGLFIGRLGLSRTFLVTPRGIQELQLPTDLLGITVVRFDPNRADENYRAALGPAASSMSQAIERLGLLHRRDANLRQLVDDRFVHQAAAICFRQKKDENPEFLLVRTIGGRYGQWTFPKGMIAADSGELWFTALKEAHDEAGASGEVFKQPFTVYKQRKGAINKDRYMDLNVVGFLMEVRRTQTPAEQDRDPTWFDFASAGRALEEGRTYEHARELKRVVKEARDEIRRLRSPEPYD